MERPENRSWRRAQAVLIGIAAAALGLLVIVVVLCFPYLKQREQKPQPTQQLQQAPVQETVSQKDPLGPDETEPEETGETTVPPELNPYTSRDFQFDRHNYLYCTKQDSYPGVDVSAFQGNIDWQRVADSGIRFAMFRLGYRGYGTAGRMVEDEYVHQNLKGAREAGLSVGAYFFSQAINVKEVDEEIEFMLNILGDYTLDLPIVLDWEYISDTARTAHVDGRTLTDCLKHFCDVMTAKGFKCMIYFNWNQSSKMLVLSELEDYPFWLALYQDWMTYPFRVEMWQYSNTGRVPGINGDVDLNVYMPDFRQQNG